MVKPWQDMSEYMLIEQSAVHGNLLSGVRRGSLTICVHICTEQ